MSAPAQMSAASELSPTDDLWRLRPSLDPRAPLLGEGRSWDTATFSARLGLRVLRTLRSGGARMGPALHCGEHGVIHVPITPWPSLPQANLLMVRRANLFCPGGGPRICVGSIWLLPPAGTAVLTDAHAVFDALHLVLNSARSAPRPLAGQPVDGAFSRESADA